MDWRLGRSASGAGGAGRQQPDRDQGGRERRGVDRIRAAEADDGDQDAGHHGTGHAGQREDNVLDGDCREQLVVAHQPRREGVAGRSLETVGGRPQRLGDEQEPNARLGQERVHEQGAGHEQLRNVGEQEEAPTSTASATAPP
jgi:hypothetical protein